MKCNKDRLLIITNLYPLPWEPNRATFNRQQFENLAQDYELDFLIPVAFMDWFKNRKQVTQTANRRFIPYFFTPKIGRRFYAVFMFFSILFHSGFWIKQRKAKKILASWAYPDAVAANWLSKLFSIDFYFKVHGSDIDIQCQNKSRAKQVVNMSKNAKGILSVSQALANKMITLGINANKIEVIYNGVDHHKFNVQTQRPYKNHYLLFVGNLKHDKGVMELLTGFAQISQQHPDLHLVYAGNGVMMASLQSQTAQLKITDRVKFLGNINHGDVPQWLSHCQALVLPSYHEGVPNVLLEAMACGKPVIATNVGGIPEIIDESICGHLIPPENSHAVASAITALFEKNWSEVAIKQYSQQFSWERNKKQLINLLSADKN